MRRRRTTGENNDVGGEGKHAAQVHLTALLPQPCEVEKVSKRRCEHKLRRFFQRLDPVDKVGVKKVRKWTNRPISNLFPAGAGSPADRARASWQGCPVATWRCSFR